MVLEVNLIIATKQMSRGQWLDQSYEFCGWGFLVSFLACNAPHHVDRAKQLVKVSTILFNIDGITTDNY